MEGVPAVELIDPALDPADPLNHHILTRKFPLVRRGITLSDGNCWYDSISDQIQLHNLGHSSDHRQLRQDVCKALPSFSQVPQWIQITFGGSKAQFQRFIKKHKKINTWTDNDGIMVQATALLLCRRIILVGTANHDPENRGFSVIEGGPGSEAYPPLIVGYYQGNHYQSLQEVQEGIMEEEWAAAFNSLGKVVLMLTLEKLLSQVGTPNHI